MPDWKANPYWKPKKISDKTDKQIFLPIPSICMPKMATFAAAFGEMPEWSIGAVSKTVDYASGPRVRIPVSPHFHCYRDV